MGYKRKNFKKKSTTNKPKKDNMGKIKHIKTIVDGITFDSKMESEYYIYLKSLKAKGIVKDFELQPKFLLQEKFIIVNGEKILGSNPNFNKIKRATKAKTIQDIEYIADFKVIYSNGIVKYVDTKGQETADFILKKKMFAYKYPDLVLEILILDNNQWIDYAEYKKREKDRKKVKKAKEQESANSIK